MPKMCHERGGEGLGSLAVKCTWLNFLIMLFRCSVKNPMLYFKIAKIYESKLPFCLELGKLKQLIIFVQDFLDCFCFLNGVCDAF